MTITQAADHQLGSNSRPTVQAGEIEARVPRATSSVPGIADELIEQRDRGVGQHYFGRRIRIGPVEHG